MTDTSNEYLNQFKAMVRAEEVRRRDVMMLMGKEDKTEVEYELVRKALKEFIAGGEHTAVFHKRNDNNKHVFFVHTFDIVLSMISKTWVDISDIDLTKIDLTSANTVSQMATELTVRLLNVLNDSEAMREHIDNFKILIHELSVTMKNEVDMNKRYAKLYNGVSNILDHIQNTVTYTYIAAYDKDTNKSLTGNITDDVSSIVIIDNLFCSTAVLDLVPGDADAGEQ